MKCTAIRQIDTDFTYPKAPARDIRHVRTVTQTTQTIVFLRDRGLGSRQVLHEIAIRGRYTNVLARARSARTLAVNDYLR